LRLSLPATAGARCARAGTLISILGLGLLAACQGPAPSPTASPAASVVASGPPASRSTSPSSAGSVEVDPSLLSILPVEVEGVPVHPDPETAAAIAVDPSLANDVEAVAVALAISPGSSGGEDLVIANVVRLRPDVYNETFFRSWRDSYDSAACEPAGGVTGNAEAEIDGRQIFIGSCVNGGITYHVRYGEDVLVSITSVGDGRFGEQLVKNLGG
jgi:hypothetical protein